MLEGAKVKHIEWFIDNKKQHHQTATICFKIKLVIGTNTTFVFTHTHTSTEADTNSKREKKMVRGKQTSLFFYVFFFRSTNQIKLTS